MQSLISWFSYTRNFRYLSKRAEVYQKSFRINNFMSAGQAVVNFHTIISGDLLNKIFNKSHASIII